MRINPQALERLRAAPLSGGGIARILEELLRHIDITGDPAVMSLNLDYQTAEVEAAEGDLIPVVTLSLRPATLLTKTVPDA